MKSSTFTYNVNTIIMKKNKKKTKKNLIFNDRPNQIYCFGLVSVAIYIINTNTNKQEFFVPKPIYYEIFAPYSGFYNGLV